jgi:CHAT domain-containing protein/tetratricopeptide (TPR) repeat protein
MRRAVLADAASRPRRAAGSVGRLRRVLVLLLLLTPQLPTSLPASSPVTTMRAEVTRCEREAGPDSVETAVALARLAMQLWQRHELDEADSTAARAQALFERLFGAESLRVADALNIRGAVAFARNDVRAATEAWEGALRIRERELGGESPEVAAVLNNLASAKSALGELEAARALLARALDVSDRSVGPTHASSLSFRVTLTSVLHREGRLEEARRLCEQTLRLLADAPGADRLTEPHTHFNLAAILRSANDPSEAKVHSDLAFRALNAALGPTHPSTQQARLLSIECRITTGEKRAGMQLIRRALEELLAAGKGTSPDAALLHLILARDAHERGDDDAAFAEASETLRIREACFGPEHELVRHAVEALGRFEFARERYAECERWWRRVVAIDDKSRRSMPSSRATGRAQLAQCLAAEGRMAEAAACLEPVLATFDERIDLELPALAEFDRLVLATHAQAALDLLLVATRTAREGFSDRVVYGHLLRHKGAIARGMLAHRAWLQRNADAQQKALLDRLGDVVARLSATSLALSPRTAQELGELLEERKRLERRLSDVTSMAPISTAATVEQVAAALGEGEVLVDFVVHEETPWKPSASRVCAFVVTRAAGVRRVDLGAWSELEPWIAAHRELCARRTGTAAAGPLAESTAKSLRARVWDPLGPDVARARRVIVCPDAGLALLPFATLPGARPRTFLIEDVEMHVVSSAHELARSAPPVPAEKLVAVGGIDYGTSAEPARGRAVANAGELPPFGRLPGSAEEVEALAARLRGKAAECLLLGEKATEGALVASLRGATLVHLATHGFFLDLASRLGPSPARPLLLDNASNGIALANANGRGLEPANDGILTADEATLLDLSSCRLVVVSACESGLGKVMSGEHLLGLRRALHLAGAQRTLTALWRVDDKKTCRWMELFYEGLLGEGKAPSAAFLAAQRRYLEQSRAAGGDGEPGVFGAFILEGIR